MSKIHTTGQKGPDGILKLEVPISLPDTDADVPVVVQSRHADKSRIDEKWLQFISETAGNIDDHSFFRREQGEYEVREPLPCR